MKNKKAQFSWSNPQIWIIAVVVIFIGFQVYNKGYDNGFNEANQSYTKCLENMDLSEKQCQGLLSQKDLEIEDLAGQSKNWRDAYSTCINKPKPEIIFPHFTFNLIIYNVLIIGVSVLLFFNLFKGTVKISFGRIIDEIIQKNKEFIWLSKIIIFVLATTYILYEIFQFIKNVI